MNWFLRLKLAHKLLLTFLVCSVLTGIVGGFGLLHITELGKSLDNTCTGTVVPAQCVAEAAARLTAHSRAMVRLPALKEPADVKEAVKRAEAHMDKFRKVLDAYRATDLQPKEKELLTKLDDLIPNYLAQNNKVADLASAGNFAAAAELSNGDARIDLNGLQGFQLAMAHGPDENHFTRF